MKLYRTDRGWWLQERLASEPAKQDAAFVLLTGFRLDEWLAGDASAEYLRDMAMLSSIRLNEVPQPQLPLESQEIWAAGVTYLRSKSARMEESNFSANAYDRVYEAPRPEIFFKATASRCVGDGQPLRLRDDSRWMVPEPELALIVSHTQKIVGFTIGDDLSCRDIEGENLLYLPQAKTWDGCCALGPCILINEPQVDLLRSTIDLTIRRAGHVVFIGSTPISRMKRAFGDLVTYLFRNQVFPRGVALLTGTGIVPPEDFTLQADDEIVMHVDEIGTLTNIVQRV